MNEHREWRKCVVCKYEHYRQDRVTTQHKVRHGIMPATPNTNPVVPKSEVIPSFSSNSSTEPIVLLDTSVKTRSRTRVVKTQYQIIEEHQERNKDRIATFKKYNKIRKNKLPATPAGLTNKIASSQ